ncbi:hypothetical protein M493_16715 [Geobacillus genomosp. 3]|uniref:Uncharacterized protein n=1 Tax=Geobacillus genomosp. 3 TaxID=1921421 RepID=S5ZGX0_GEOG3|nr:hypothetical protein M493_16715 [Geobacillus genomosp. 3]
MKIGLCYRDSIHEEFIDELIKYVDFLELMPDITGYKETKRLFKLCNSHFAPSRPKSGGFFHPGVE